MATLPILETSLYNLIADTAPKQFVDTVRKESFLYDLAVKKVMDNSKAVQWGAKVTSNSSVGTRAVGSDGPAASATFNVQPSQATGTFIGAFGLDIKQIAEIDFSTARGQMILMDLLNYELRDIVSVMSAQFATGLISGTGPAASNGFLGLALANGWIDDAGSLAGGINRATYTTWASKVYDNSATPRTLTLAIIEAALDSYINTITTINDWSNGNWVCLTGSAQASVMRGFTGADTPTRQVNANERTLKILGYSDMSIRGQIPVVVIPGYTTGRIDFLKMDDFEVHYLPGSTSTGTNDNGTPFHFQAVDVSGPRYTWNVHAFPTSIIRNPRMSSFSIQDLS